MYQQSNGYAPKTIHLNSKETEARLVNGIRKSAAAVKSTLGARGTTVIIEGDEFIGGQTVTKDGVTVMNTVFLPDALENTAAQILKEAAQKTAVEAGDGTTTSVVLAESLIDAGLEVFTPETNRTKVFRNLKSILDNEIIPEIQKNATPCNAKNLKQIATVSANNDAVVGKLIFDAYNAVGLDENSIVTIERSETPITYNKVTNGMRLDRGYATHLYKNSEAADSCIFEDTFVLVSDLEISNYLQIKAILEPICTEKLRLLIIAPMTQEMVSTLAMNVQKNGFHLCSLQPPSFGYRQHELMEDIAMVTGATYFSAKSGDDITHITLDDLGRAKKSIVSRDETVIIKDETMVSKEDIAQRLSELREQLSNEKKKNEKVHIRKRMATIEGFISQLYVGGETDTENKELTDRVDDSVCAVRSALESGIIAGGGITFLRLSEMVYKKMTAKKKLSPDMDEAYRMLHIAFSSPLVQILKNAEEDIETILNTLASKPLNYGYDVITQKYGDMLVNGIVDPSKVAIQAITNALSVATTILSTKVAITKMRSYEARG